MTTSAPLRISRLRVPSEEELPQSVLSFFAGVERQSGFVPNWLRGFALDPGHFERLNAFLFPLLQGTPHDGSAITLREREILATVVSVHNRCSYCHALHVHDLGVFLNDPWLAHRIALDHREVTEISDREHALIDFAVRLTDTPNEIAQSEIETLRSHGLTDSDVYEVVQIVAAINATNRISLALGLLPDPEVFEHDSDQG